jgi:hypothetical protein
VPELETCFNPTGVRAQTSLTGGGVVLLIRFLANSCVEGGVLGVLGRIISVTIMHNRNVIGRYTV